MRGARTFGAAVTIALLPLLPLVHAACVDGVTPNCSDPAVKCGPEIDGSRSEASEATVLPESAPPDAAPEAAPDAPPDPDLDAGDGG